MRERLALGVVLLGVPAVGQTIFSDSFDAGASPLWGNERGSWGAAGGAYAAAQPSNSPPTMSTLPFVMGDFELELDVLDVVDGGIWIHLDAAAQNGLLLVTGGFNQTGNGFYWHVLTNGGLGSPLGLTGPLFTPQEDLHLRVVARGSTYLLYLGNQPQYVGRLTLGEARTGRLGLYDYALGAQSFDNVVLRRVCYPNCDGSTAEPVLNVGDFTCFLQRYAAGESYANCDLSTAEPVLNVGDFTCFLQAYAAGCP